MSTAPMRPMMLYDSRDGYFYQLGIPVPIRYMRHPKSPQLSDDGDPYAVCAYVVCSGDSGGDTVTHVSEENTSLMVVPIWRIRRRGPRVRRSRRHGCSGFRRIGSLCDPRSHFIHCLVWRFGSWSLHDSGLDYCNRRLLHGP